MGSGWVGVSLIPTYERVTSCANRTIREVDIMVMGSLVNLSCGSNKIIFLNNKRKEIQNVR